jgi:zinc protease
VVRQEVLENGLTLLVRELRTAPVVALNLWVDVGSVDDPEGLAGISHFVEHLLFSGADGGATVELSHVVQDAGGYLNAQTGADHTLYYQVVPSDGWQDVLAAQVLAVKSPAFDDASVEIERSVIMEEARTGENDPSVFVWRRLMETAFVRHPSRRPIVGTAESVARITTADLHDHIRRYYTPGNMVQVIVGDIDTDDAVERAREVLGELPAGPPVSREIEPEPVQSALRATSFPGALEQTYLALSFHAPPVLHSDMPALEALAGLLGAGRSSRLRKSLQVGQGLVTAIGAFVVGHRDNGIFAVRAVLPSASTLDSTVEEVFREIETLRTTPVGAGEMEKNLTRLEASYVLEHETADTIAENLGFFAVHGDHRYAEEYIDRLARVTPEDIRRVAAEYLRAGNASLVTYTPGGAGLAEGDRSESMARIAERVRGAAPAIISDGGVGWRAPARFERPMMLAERTAFQCSRTSLGNGPPLVSCESHAVPIVSLALGFRGGFVVEPDELAGITYLTQKLLLRGTESRSADALADDIEGLGTAISTAVDRDGFGLGVSVLSKHFGEAMAILSDVVGCPSFPAQHFEQARQEVLAEIGQIEDHPWRLAVQTLLPLVFGDHPYGKPTRGTRETLGCIACGAVREWHAQTYTANNLLLCVAGDITQGLARRELERGLAGMRRSSPSSFERTADFVPIGRVEKEAPGSGQSTVALGFAGPPVGGDDSAVMRFVARALSMMGGPLWRALRDRPPHAYAAGAALLPLRHGGAFVGYATTPPGSEEETVEALTSELRRLAVNGLEDAELERGKRHFTGTLEIALQRGAARAASYATAEVLGIGYERILDLPARIRRITNEDVTETLTRFVGDDCGMATVILRAK